VKKREGREGERERGREGERERNEKDVKCKVVSVRVGEWEVENIFRFQFYVKRILRRQNITNKLERNGCLQNIQTTNWQFIVGMVVEAKNILRK
jgi:hypothetical protein